METYCNPLDLGYRYQHMKEGPKLAGFREGADPTLVLFKGKYYLFVSMSAGFWWSEDMLNWNFHSDPNLLIYDYAPSARRIGDCLYYCASRRNANCPILRSRDPLNEPFEEVAAPFAFWDPDLFCDDDGRVYLYWGCTNTEPIYGVELNAETLMPTGERKPLIFEDSDHLGFERPGDNGIVDREHSVVYRMLSRNFNPETGRIELPPEMERMSGYSSEALTRIYLSVGKPHIEGSYMTKYKGRYYLQYATPGTQFNTYCDVACVSDSPLGPFRRQQSSPFSCVPGGFITGAGQGSTIFDAHGNLWHASTMRISINHDFERRVGLFPAGFDSDGVLFCNQNFADYPRRIPRGRFDPWSVQPEWMLLSYNKPTRASSGEHAELAVNENIRDWWSAGRAEPGEWLMVDLERVSDIRAIQVNLADQDLRIDFPPEAYGDERHTRHIDTRPQLSNYAIDISTDGSGWTRLETVSRDCVNGYYEYPQGIRARFVRVTGGELPYGQPLRIAGLRIFGLGHGEKPRKAQATARRTGGLDAIVSWKHIDGAQGCNVRYGVAPDKLYQSCLTYGTEEVKLSTLVSGQKYYVRVDSFNESGVTGGDITEMEG